MAEMPSGEEAGGVERRTSAEVFRDKQAGRGGVGLSYLGMEQRYGPHNNPYAAQPTVAAGGASPRQADDGEDEHDGEEEEEQEEEEEHNAPTGCDDATTTLADKHPVGTAVRISSTGEVGTVTGAARGRVGVNVNGVVRGVPCTNVEATAAAVDADDDGTSPQQSQQQHDADTLASPASNFEDDATTEPTSAEKGRKGKKRHAKLDSPRTLEFRQQQEQEQQRAARKEAKRQARVNARKKRDAILKARLKKDEDGSAAGSPEHGKAVDGDREDEQKLLMKALKEKELSERRERRLEEEARRKKEKQRAAERQKRIAMEVERKLAEEREEQERYLQAQQSKEKVERLKRLHERSKQAELRGQRGNSELRKVLKQKPYHVVLEERAAEAMREEERRRKEEMERVRGQAKRPLNYRDMVTEHEQKYTALLQQQQALAHEARRKPPVHLAPMRNVYHGKSHEIIQQEMQAARSQHAKVKEEQESRRKRMQNFASLVKEMYPPGRPHTNPHHASPGKLPPVRAGAQSAEPQPQHDPLFAKRKGDAYLRGVLDHVRAHPKPLAEPEPEPDTRPQRCARDLRGDRYLRDAIKANKPNTQHPQEINDEERAKHLKQLRKRAAKLAANIGTEQQSAEESANQQYFAAIAAKMDLLLALDP